MRPSNLLRRCAVEGLQHPPASVRELVQERRPHLEDRIGEPVWGVKTKFALREIPICRRNGGFETLQGVPLATSENVIDPGRKPAGYTTFPAALSGRPAPLANPTARSPTLSARPTAETRFMA